MIKNDKKTEDKNTNLEKVKKTKIVKKTFSGHLRSHLKKAMELKQIFMQQKMVSLFAFMTLL